MSTKSIESIANPFDLTVGAIEAKTKKVLPKLDWLSRKEAAKEFMRIFKARAPNGKLTEETKEITKNLVLYFLNDEASKYDLNRGIYLYGPTGTGKTTLMQCFADFTHTTRLKYFRMRSSKQIVSEVLSKGDSIELLKYSDSKTIHDLAFDDLGHETECKIYGTTINCLEDILVARYEKKLLTHCTSNLTMDFVKKRYGQRLESRMYEMFNIILINGEDKRKQKD